MNVTPRINPFTQAQATTFNGTSYFPAATQRAGFSESVQKGTFKDVMTNLVKETDRTLTLPDELMSRALTTGDVDVHEVMIANTKADIAVNIASQVVTKVIQAYERVQQIQV